MFRMSTELVFRKCDCGGWNVLTEDGGRIMGNGEFKACGHVTARGAWGFVRVDFVEDEVEEEWEIVEVRFPCSVRGWR